MPAETIAHAERPGKSPPHFNRVGATFDSPVRFCSMPRLAVLHVQTSDALDDHSPVIRQHRQAKEQESLAEEENRLRRDARTGELERIAGVRVVKLLTHGLRKLTSCAGVSGHVTNVQVRETHGKGIARVEEEYVMKNVCLGLKSSNHAHENDHRQKCQGGHENPGKESRVSRVDVAEEQGEEIDEGYSGPTEEAEENQDC